MFYTGFAAGCFVGATFGVIIMALVIAGKEADGKEDEKC